jgi:hypothetical protein
MELPAAPPDGGGDRSREASAERLLAAIHATCSHDLPNQILALRSLIHLMDMDEVIPPGAPGREYLERLGAVAEKTAGLTDFLKAIARLARVVPQPRRVALLDLFREAIAESRSALEADLAWDIGPLAGAVFADRDLVHAGLGELLRSLAALGAKTVTVLSSGTGCAAGRVAVDIKVGGAGLRVAAEALEQRPDFLLARERLRIADVGLTTCPVIAQAEATVALDFAAEGS